MKCPVRWVAGPGWDGPGSHPDGRGGRLGARTHAGQAPLFVELWGWGVGVDRMRVMTDPHIHVLKQTLIYSGYERPRLC